MSKCEECGIGPLKPLVNKRRGRHRRFCNPTCRQRSNGRKGAGVSGNRGKHLFKTGEHINRDGYRKVLVGDHPFPRKSHYMSEHVKVMEAHIGRRITPSECVHHVNGNRLDNRLDNLRLMGKGEHSRMHWGERKGNA